MAGKPSGKTGSLVGCMPEYTAVVDIKVLLASIYLGSMPESRSRVPVQVVCLLLVGWVGSCRADRIESKLRT